MLVIAAGTDLIVVADVHAVVNDTTRLKTDVAVCSAIPKLSPDTVNDA
jgi:hypothetical protein